MTTYSELDAALDKVLREASESDEYKRRLRQLVENALSKTYRDEDIRELLDKAKDSDEEGE